MPRRRATRFLVAAAVCAAASGCITGHVHMSADDRREAERQVQIQGDRQLRLSYFVTSFFGDDSKLLLSQYPPEELKMVLQPDGTPVIPETTLKIIPAGTPARILGLEFPTSWAIASRIPYTPRFQPWLFVAVQGEPTDIPFVIPLNPRLSTVAEALAEVDRYLAREDLKPFIASLPEGMRTDVRNKSARQDMPVQALEMVWGYPDLKRITFDEEGTRTESWEWGDGIRSAIVKDGRAIKLTQPPTR